MRRSAVRSRSSPPFYVPRASVTRPLFFLEDDQQSAGEMAERSKAHAWKACRLQKGLQGSNPCLSAIFEVFFQGQIMKTKYRLEGFTLTVQNVKHSVDFYTKKLDFECVINAAPHFAMIRLGSMTIGLLSFNEAKKEGVAKTSVKQNKGIHVEIGTDQLDKLYKELVKRGVKFHTPPHDEPWERSATAFDPDGYSVEFAQGRRGKNQTKK